MMRPQRSALGGAPALLVLATAALLCPTACAPVVSDTGFTGSWGRGEQQVNGRSVISFWDDSDGTPRFRANRWAADGSHTLRCGRTGPCVEFERQKPVYEYDYRVSRRQGDDGLFVECQGRTLDGDGSPLHYVERFTVRPGGLELDVSVVERNHEPQPDPFVRATFRKVSNDPFSTAR